MRWRRGTQNDDVIDQRASSAGGRGRGGGFPLPGGRGGAGVGGAGLLVVVVLLVLRALGGGDGGFDVGGAVDRLPGGVPAAQGGAPASAGDDEAELVDFFHFVVGDVQDVWTAEFQQAGLTYERAQLVLFRDAVQTGCGTASSQVGPFYCPADRRVYIDLGFMVALQERLGALGDMAQAYIVAHEVGHHVQTLLGIDDQVRQAVQEDPSRQNELSIRQELQADCLAGVWAHSAYTRELTEQGDLEEALNAAAAVGDDRIQAQETGRIDRETWTHGSAEQRSRWFREGFDSGDPNRCDTFAADSV